MYKWGWSPGHYGSPPPGGSIMKLLLILACWAWGITGKPREVLAETFCHSGRKLALVVSEAGGCPWKSWVSKADISQFSLPIASILQALLYLLSKTGRPYYSFCATRRLSRAPQESPLCLRREACAMPQVTPPSWEYASLSLKGKLGDGAITTSMFWN